MNRFRSQFGPDVTFVMASDSPEWIKKYFRNTTDAYMLSEYQQEKRIERSAFEFGVLSKCNHSIIRYLPLG